MAIKFIDGDCPEPQSFNASGFVGNPNDWFTPECQNATDVQVGGDHYMQFTIQPIEFITKNSIPYIEANVIKYICRHKMKNGKEDLLKAKHYIDLLIESEYK
jgi:Protein of unknwon function (DUF3310)